MPPKAKTSKKRARSPSPDSKPSDKTQTRSSKRTKKDASAAPTAGGGKPPAQKDVAGAVEATAVKTNERPAAPGPPSFHGNFDMYSMKLPFLNSVFAPKRDYATLLKVIRTYQAKPENTAQIFLPEDASKAGRFRSLAVEDPMQEWPFDIALRSLALKGSLTFTAREREATGTPDAQFFSEPSAATPGVAAAVALAQDQCGIKSSKGAFKMRRAWVSADGTDEVFEGVFSVNIVYSSLYRRKCDESSLRANFAFWAIRARVGEDGKEIGLGPAAGRR
ncbi:hypothetical protein LXA43DRAFT_1108240 [Ganoderma leucocontextum]|nr:hypothetical protein LXA43DRAFT_1108240 [Ganoderma leucocontextum]